MTKKLILTAFAAIGLMAGVAPVAHAFTAGLPHANYHSGPYDNTGRSPGQSGLEGGGG